MATMKPIADSEVEPLDRGATMEVGGHRANGPSRGRHLTRGADMADVTCPKCRSGFTCTRHLAADPPSPQERRERLLSWMSHPQHPSLPQHAAIDYERDARALHWTAAKLVEISGVYDDLQIGQARRVCLSDLRTLVRAGEVMKWGEGAGRTWSLPIGA